MKRIRLVIVFISIFVYSLDSNAQQLETSISLHGFADNREYMKSDRYPQTIFGTRVSPELGLLLDSTHRIRAGFNALYEFGSKSSNFFTEIKPVVYYQYDKDEWDFFIGSFPRANLLDDYPLALLNDTLQYYRPNVEGMLARFATQNWKHTVWIDWTSRQTDLDREVFLFGLSGSYRYKKFFVSHYAYMLHNAGAKIELPDDHLQDNGVALISIGLDLSNLSPMDSLTLSAGGMMSFERTRNVSDWNTPKGAVVGIYAEYKRISLKNTLYIGEGHHLVYGDAFYTAKSYDRLDLGWAPIRYKNIEGKFTLSFHFVEGVVDNQQAFSLKYLFNKRGKL